MMKSMNLIMFLMINMSNMLILINMIPTHYKSFHPLILGSILMIMNMFISLNSSIYLNNNWWSYITFLIIIGGLMILFLYFTSFINNMITSMKMSFLKSLNFKFLVMFLFFIIMTLNFKKFLIWYKPIMNSFNFQLNFKLILLYMYNIDITMIFLIIYLLISLSMIVKMIILNKFTLRKMS